MKYIFTFDIGSILFLSLTIYFYMRQRRVRDLTDRIYCAMLICGMVALVFDFAAAAMEYNALSYPAWTLYAVNMLFIVGMQACLPLFFLYVLVVTGLYYRMTRIRYLPVVLPYAITMLLLLLSLVSKHGIFYIDEAHIYRHGSTHMMLYVDSLIYVGSSIVLLLLNYGAIRRAERRVLLVFVGLLFLAMGLQIAFPRYLLTASATALSLTAMFYVLQSPFDRINPFTGAFNRMLLPTLLTDYHARGRPYTLVQFSLHSFDEIIRLYGSQLSDSLLRELAGLMQRTFLNDTVVYMDTWEFCIICNAVLSKADVRAMARRIPDTLSVGGVEIPIDLHTSAVAYDSAYGATDTLLTADYLFRRIRVAPTDDVLYADDDLRKTCAALLKFEGSLDAILSEGAPALRFAPIVRPDGALAAEDVSLHIEHPDMQNVPYSQFMQALAQGGYVWRYYQQLFALLAPLSGRYSAECPACVQLSVAACMHEGAAARLCDVIGRAGLSPDSVTFHMREEDVAEALPVLHDNIRQLAALGCGFRLDAFASGLTDLSQLTSLPVGAVKLDRSLVRAARQGGRQLQLLHGTLRVLSDLGKTVVCAGVDQASDLENAVAAGATLLQGTYLNEKDARERASLAR